METGFKGRLRQKETLVGSIVTIPSADVAEIMSLVGWDYLWIDTEHATIDSVQTQRILQAVGGRCPCIQRIPEIKEVWIKKALDVGCQGIVVPQVKSAEEAKRVVDWSYYPPVGKRSVGVARAHDYGKSFGEYVQRINEEIVIVLQIEHIDAVENLDSILKVSGIDALLIGPLDLSGSLDVIGKTNHPRVLEAIGEVKRKCKEAGMPLGIFVPDPMKAMEKIDEGFSLIALNMDTAFLLQAAQAALGVIRG